MANEKNEKPLPSKEEVSTKTPLTIEELQAAVEQAESALVEANEHIANLEEKLASSEALVTEMEQSLASAEVRAKTGKNLIKHEDVTYEVIGKYLPSLSMASELGKTTINAVDIEKYPQIINDLIAMKSGFLQVVID